VDAALVLRVEVASRFWPKVDCGDGCWEWRAARFPGGYGSFGLGGRQHGAHRISWALANGEWPSEWVLHKCGNRGCVNPDHLYVGDAKQNMRDALDHGTLPNASKTSCKHGHPFDRENTYVIPSTGHRQCRTCAAANMAKRKLRTGVPNAEKTHCKFGHPFDAINTGRRASGARRCLACHRIREGERHAMKRQRGVA